MGVNAKTVKVTLKTIADISDVTSNVQQIQKVINQLKLPENLKSNFTQTFSEIEKSANKASQALTSGLKTKGDVSAFTKNMDRINTLMIQLQKNMSKISPDILKNSLDIDTTKLEAAKKTIADIRQQLTQKIDTSGLQKVVQAAENLSKVSKAKSIQNFVNAFKEGNFDEAEKALQKLEQGLSKVTDPSKLDTYKTAVEAMRLAFTQLISDGDIQNLQAQLNAAQQALQDLGQTEFNDLLASFQPILTALPKMTQETKDWARATDNANVAQQQLNSELEQFKSRITYFFGMSNAVNLFQRAIRSAYETVKDLDAVMTETAVVTDFSVGDMWSQLPEYTQRANELGVSIHGAYEAATIYYQQGLKTNEVMAVSNETLKMARIAGLDAATATDRMTNALRGFNMELNETNAQRVNDVYSKLAAITASDTDEISTAMTKVASLANNANMEFETTSAFLAQMIETTRESAETAGTALKTVIARFSEVKELYNEGELLGTDSEGEAIDVNKVSTALRTAGINLNEYLTGMKGLDDIFIELAQKWNSLDIVQQRYIATMAAGSRQQSRFIAMMSDYDRTMELVNAANNSSGASNEQYQKTLESLETKLTQLENAWNTFLMSVANSDAIKIAVDTLTQLITSLNDLTSTLPGSLSGLSKLLIVIGGLKVGKKIFDQLIGHIGATLMNGMKDNGKKSGLSYIQSLRESIQKNGKSLKGILKSVFTDANATESLKESIQENLKLKNTLAFNDGLDKAANKQGIGTKAVQEIRTVYTEQGFEAAKKKAESYDLNLDDIIQKTDQFADSSVINLNAVAVSAGALGAAFLGISTILEDMGASDGAVKTFKTIGSVLMGVSAILPVVSLGVKALGLSFTTAGIEGTVAGVSVQLAWWEILVIMVAVAAVVGALIAAFTALHNATPEAKLEAAKEAADDAAEAAQNAADAFTNLSDSWDSLGDKYKALKDMTRGSQEWRQAVQEINSEVLDLMDNYKGLIPTMKDGVLRITDEDMKKVSEEYEKISVKASSAAIAAKQTVINAQNNVNRKEARANFRKDSGGYLLFSSNDDAFDAFSVALSKGEILPDINGNYSAATEDWARKYERENNLVSNSLGHFVDALDDTIPKLIKYGDELLQADTQMDVYYTALSANAVSMAKLGEDMQDYATTFMSSERMRNIVAEEEKNIGDILSEEKRNDLRDEYAQGKGYENYEAYRKDHDNTDISDEQLKTQVAAMRAQEAATNSVEIFTKKIDDLSPALKKIYAKSEGQALNRKDIQKLTKDARDSTKYADYKALVGKSVEDIQRTYDDQIHAAWDAMDRDMQAAYGSAELFAKEYANALLLSSESYATATQNIESVGLSLSDGKFIDLSSGALKSLSDNLLSIFNVTGEQGFNEIKEAFVDLTSNMSSEETEKFANALNSIDWSSADSIDTLSEVVEELDIDVTHINGDLDGFEDKLIKCANATRNIDLDTVTEQVRSLSSIANSINKGAQGRSFSEGDYKSLIESGALKTSDFAYNIESGNYDYLGDSTEQIVNAIKEQTAQLLGTDQLERRIKSGEAFEYALELGTVDPTDQNSLYHFLKRYLASAGGNASIRADSVQKYKDANSIEGLKRLYDIILDDYEKIPQYQSQLDAVTIQGQIAQAQLNDPAYNANRVNGTDGNIYSSALTAQATAAGLPTEALDAYIKELRSADAFERQFAADQLASMTNSYNEATALGIDTKQLQAYTNTLQTFNNKLTDAQALEIALANTKLNDGLNEIIGSYEDWTALIDKESGLIKTTTSDDAAAFNELQKSVNKMLNTSKDLSDVFWNNVENMENLKKVAEGDTAALEELQKAAVADYIVSLKAEAGTEQIAIVLDELANYILGYDLPELDAGAQLDDSEFIEGCKNLIRASNMTQEQVSNAFKAMGYDVEFDENPQKVVQEERVPVVWYRASGNLFSSNFQLIPEVKEQVHKFVSTVPAPTIKTLTSTGSGGGGVSSSNKSSGAVNATKASDSGSGGSSEKPSYWKNPYDELYNLQEQINESLRTREALERRYQKLLKKTETDLSEIRQAYYDQIEQLRAEADLQQAMAQGRARQLSNIANETYTDSEGVQRSFASMGVTKYASYDTSTGIVTIDWEGLDAIAHDASREEEGNAAEAYISRLEELVEGYKEIRDKLWDIEDKIEGLREEAIQTYLNFEDRVMEAVVNESQEQIDAFEAMSDEISEATNKMLDSIKEEISLERQIRDNTKTEEEIADMENRLAYLRRDTSGANDLAIMQLEKDLKNARQNYSDTLIDQALDQMQHDADLAAEQRAKQQETLQTQLDIMKENGSLWDRVYQLIRDAEGDDGSFSRNSELAQLLKDNESFDSLSNIGKAKWWDETVADYKAARIGRDEAEDKYGIDADNDGIIASTGTQKAIDDVGNQSTRVISAPITTTTTTAKQTRTNEEKYGVALAIINGGYGWGSGLIRKANLEAKGFNYEEIQGIVNDLMAEGRVHSGAWVGAYYGIRDLSDYAMSRFKAGGLADFTGPAWLDGTKSHPELVLDATDSQNFITLKNILAQLLNGQGTGVINSGGGDNYFDIDISAELGSDYDVDQLADRIKKQIYDNGTYRNVNTMNYLR